MHRLRLQPGQGKLAKPLADCAFMHCDRPTTRGLGLQIHTPPAIHLMDRQVWPFDHKLTQLGFLRLIKAGRLARALAALEPFNPFRIVAMHPVAEGLSIHAIDRGSFAPAPAI